MTSNRDFWAVLPLFCQANLHISYTFRGLVLLVLGDFPLLHDFDSFPHAKFFRFLAIFLLFYFFLILDRARFGASFPHTFPQVRFSRFHPRPHCAGIMVTNYSVVRHHFFVENLFYQTLWDIHSAIHFSARVIIGLISYLICSFAGAIFFVSTGRNSILEFEWTSPFLAAFQANF